MFLCTLAENKTVRLYSPKLAAASKGLVKSKGFLIGLLKVLFEVFEVSANL